MIILQLKEVKFFVVEQDCVYKIWTDKDVKALHIIGL